MIFSAPDFQLEVRNECASTNEVLLSERERPGFHGRALLALRQTAGYGRRGKEWQTGEGNLALSIGFRLPGRGEEVTLLPFLAGLALVDALEGLLPPGRDLRLKWPNDVYLEGRKLSGLIAQARQGADTLEVVLGIGLNLAEAPAGMEAIALKELVPSVPGPVVFAERFLLCLGERLRTMADFPALRKEWEKAAHLETSLLTVVGEEGVYRAVQLLPTGELEVEGADGERRKLSSEVVSLRLAKP